ncbi:hypothetical protein GCM10009678_71800 [Actinomadura kijaniata]
MVGAAAAQAVPPAMRTAGRGTLLFLTGGAVEHPNPDRAASAIVGAAQRTYAAPLSQALAGTPLHIAHLVVVGPVGPRFEHQPDTVADHPQSAQLRASPRTSCTWRHRGLGRGSAAGRRCHRPP